MGLVGGSHNACPFVAHRPLVADTGQCSLDMWQPGRTFLSRGVAGHWWRGDEL